MIGQNINFILQSIQFDLDHINTLSMTATQDSYEEYRKHLEESLGLSNVKAPIKPMNPYMRFFFERSCEERSKGKHDWKEITRRLSEEWKALTPNQKEYYTKIYQIRLAQRNVLHDQWERLTQKKKPISPYARYVKRRYAQYTKQYPNYKTTDITKLVQKDWKALSQKERQKLEEEFEQQKLDLQANADSSQKLAEYNEKLERYHEDLNTQKEKIMKKYGVSKLSRLKEKRLEREKERQQKKAQKQLEKDQKARYIAEHKKKAREARIKKEHEEKEAKRKLREELRLKERQKLLAEKAKHLAEQEEKKKKASSSKEKQPKKEATKKEVPRSASASVKKESVKKEVKPASKSHKEVKSQSKSVPKKETKAAPAQKGRSESKPSKAPAKPKPHRVAANKTKQIKKLAKPAKSKSSVSGSTVKVQVKGDKFKVNVVQKKAAKPKAKAKKGSKK